MCYGPLDAAFAASEIVMSFFWLPLVLPVQKYTTAMNAVNRPPKSMSPRRCEEAGISKKKTATQTHVKAAMTQRLTAI